MILMKVYADLLVRATSVWVLTDVEAYQRAEANGTQPPKPKKKKKKPAEAYV